MPSENGIWARLMERCQITVDSKSFEAFWLGLTPIGLRKKDLKYNKKTGKIVSVKASKLAKKRGTLKKWAKENNLVQKKGEFGWIEKK